MGPPPRSLAAEADGCFMVWSDVGPTEYKVAARSFAPMAGSPRFVRNIASIDHVAVDLMDNAAR